MLDPGDTNGSRDTGRTGSHPPRYPASAGPEHAYSLLAGYRLARRYVDGKSVLNLGWEDNGCGAHLLARTAEWVVSLELSGEGARSTSGSGAAPNASYGRFVPPDLPHPDGHFDVSVALQVIEKLEEPEEMLSEIKRTLKPDGLLVLSTGDRAVGNGDPTAPSHARELYVPELRETLGRWFEDVRVYRLVAVAGSVIFEESEGLEGLGIETAGSSLDSTGFTGDAPATPLVVAVCGDSAAPDPDLPRLILDRDRRIFGEYADRVEDVHLLREEIRRIQETEVQAFQDTLRLREGRSFQLTTEMRKLEAKRRDIQSQNNALRARNKDLEERVRDLQSRGEQLETRQQTLQDHAETLRARNENLERHLSEIGRARTWRLLAPYRGLRLWLRSGKRRT